VLSVLMVLGATGLVVGSVADLVATTHEHVATAAELENYDARLTRDLLLLASGVLAGAAGAQLFRAARHRVRLSWLGRVLLIGGYLLVAAGLAVFTRYESVAGFYAGFGLQVVGAVAVGASGSAGRRDRGTPRSHEPSGH
jgi:hypothetical protein